MLAPTHRGCGTPVRSRLGGMQKRRALRNGGSISGRSLTVPPSGGRRGRMRERPGRVPWMLGPLEMLAPRLAGRVARVTTGNELRGTVQVGRRHHRRLLRLAAVSHFSPALLVPSPPRSMSNRHTRTRTRTHATGGTDHWVNIPRRPAVSSRNFPSRNTLRRASPSETPPSSCLRPATASLRIYISRIFTFLSK